MATEDPTFITSVLLPIGLAVIMCSLGLSLTKADFARVASAPRGVAIGLANLLILSPLLALVIAELFALDPVMAVGLVLLGASPGGVLANLMTHLARGETALSVTMSAVSSVCAVVVIPTYLDLAIDHFGATNVSDEVSMAGIVLRVFAITIIPLAIGMTYRARRPGKARALEPRLKKISVGVFVFIVGAAVVAEWDHLTKNFITVAPAALTLNIAAMAVSFTLARISGLTDRQATAIAMELGLHNSTIAIAVATTIYTPLAIPAAVYSVFMWITASAFARVMARRNLALAPA
jgi:BASS family bile acid:Na+ symporter